MTAQRITSPRRRARTAGPLVGAGGLARNGNGNGHGGRAGRSPGPRRPPAPPAPGTAPPPPMRSGRRPARAPGPQPAPSSADPPRGGAPDGRSPWWRCWWRSAASGRWRWRGSAAPPEPARQASHAGQADHDTCARRLQAQAAAPRPPHRLSSPRRSTTPTTPAAPTAQELQLTGHNELLAGNYPQAITTLRKVISSADPTSITYAYGLYDLGVALLKSGDPAAAVPILEQRLKIPNQTPVVQQTLESGAAGQRTGAGARAGSGQRPGQGPRPRWDGRGGRDGRAAPASRPRAGRQRARQLRRLSAAPQRAART